MLGGMHPCRLDGSTTALAAYVSWCGRASMLLATCRHRPKVGSRIVFFAAVVVLSSDPVQLVVGLVRDVH